MNVSADSFQEIKVEPSLKSIVPVLISENAIQDNRDEEKQLKCCNCYFYLGRFKRETTDTRREGPPAESNCSRSGRTPAGQDEQSLHDCFAAEQARLYKQVLRCWPERSCSADTSFFIMPLENAIQDNRDEEKQLKWYDA